MTEQYTVILLLLLAGACVYVVGWLDCRDSRYSRQDMNMAALLGYLNAQYKYHHRLNQKRDERGRFVE